ncbi:hypothetical protein AKJ38_02255 [candidate division MSBL1 archaeon SCGC-AAA259I14]|uniref:Uncharacterized protein n=1 Tax=candidate division MSBL1 archaeon SCGC-AAA259I14 TaxID=1698268 RepID=A0A133US29_9EURY|nr:hypothetical protein AKJ38_02255 [candidate division MSBL1 archaeon SCGC-AAA259I14]
MEKLEKILMKMQKKKMILQIDKGIYRLWKEINRVAKGTDPEEREFIRREFKDRVEELEEMKEMICYSKSFPPFLAVGPRFSYEDPLKEE